MVKIGVRGYLDYRMYVLVLLVFVRSLVVLYNFSVDGGMSGVLVEPNYYM
jgi:hypothetical protein